VSERRQHRLYEANSEPSSDLEGTGGYVAFHMPPASDLSTRWRMGLTMTYSEANSQSGARNIRNTHAILCKITKGNSRVQEQGAEQYPIA
jgi:hypothetical protein